MAYKMNRVSGSWKFAILFEAIIRKRQNIRYRATATLRRPQIKQ